MPCGENSQIRGAAPGRLPLLALRVPPLKLKMPWWLLQTRNSKQGNTCRGWHGHCHEAARAGIPKGLGSSGLFLHRRYATFSGGGAQPKSSSSEIADARVKSAKNSHIGHTRMTSQRNLAETSTISYVDY